MYYSKGHIVSKYYIYAGRLKIKISIDGWLYSMFIVRGIVIGSCSSSVVLYEIAVWRPDCVSGVVRVALGFHRMLSPVEKYNKNI